MDINALCDAVQEALDEAQGLHLRPQHAPFDAKRAHQIGGSTVDPTKPEDVRQRRARAATETLTKSMHDDRMKAEAKFRHRAGLNCRITRVAVNGCCPWCSDVAGRYRYGEEPKDIYKRHDNCDCTVTFENGRKRQDVWSKREWEAPEPGAGAGEPVVLTKEQGERLQAEHGLTKLENHSIIKAITVQDFENSDPNGVISDECKNVIINTLKSQGVSFVYDEVRVVNIPPDEEGRIEVLRTNAIERPGYPFVVLEINKSYFGGRALKQVDAMVEAQKYCVANNLMELVLHECAHAKTIRDKTYAAYEALDQELKGSVFRNPIPGRKDGKSLRDLAGDLSEYAQKDGLECISECHVLLDRGKTIDKDLKDFHDKYTK
ncbi:MAG: hypothetical protein IKQ91_07060 [Oscillospiraceae bacterium]|nr:hypothetical protein [Oscillospiraceae bacterium]